MRDFSSAQVRLGIIGAGIMGRGIAQIAAVAGIDVRVHDMNTVAAQEAVGFVGKMLDRAVEKGRMTATDADQAKSRITVSTDLADLAGMDLVIEAVVEKLEVKQSLFTQLEALVAPECILATNTSSLSVTAIASACDKPERVAGFHFFNPVPLMKLVEVVSGVRTDAAVIEQLLILAKRFGHTPVEVSDSPGFLVNHAGRGLVTEGLRILHEDITQPYVIDAVMRDCVGFRMGPFELMDLTGLDVTFPATEQIYNQYFQEPRLRPTPLQQRRYIAGLLGRKTNAGWYRYEAGNSIPRAEPEAPVVEIKSRFWLSRDIDVGMTKGITALLQQAGATVAETDKPDKNDIILVAPLGLDTSTVVTNEYLDARRTIAIDMLFTMEKRIVLMTSPATEKKVTDEAHAAFAKTGRAVSVIKDSNGFIAQRIVAVIINIATDIAQQGIAKPADIDTAVRLGLGYPQGPLAMGDAIGPKKILAILENLQAQSGDPRYRPGPWLRRRAQLGLSLLTEEITHD